MILPPIPKTFINRQISLHAIKFSSLGSTFRFLPELTSIAKNALIDVSGDASNSAGVSTDGMLLAGIQFPAAMTGTTITFDYSVDGSSWVDVFETDGTEVSYTVSAGNVVRVDPSGWAFPSNGYLRITSGATEAADRKIKLLFRSA